MITLGVTDSNSYCAAYSWPTARIEVSAIHVNSTADAIDAIPGDGICDDEADRCTLRAAIMEANALASVDTIILPDGTYTLSIPGVGDDTGVSGDLDVTDDLTITGSVGGTGDGVGGTIIDGGALDRVFHILSGTVDLSGVTVQNGSTDENDAGVLNESTLNLSNSTVRDNSNSAAPFVDGGGIFNDNAAILTLADSTVRSDSAGDDGGGIYNSNSATVTLTGSRVMDNSAEDDGGGIHNTGFGVLTLTKSKVSGNMAFGDSGGIWNFGTLTLMESIVGGNSADGSGGGIDTFISSTTELIASTVRGNSTEIDGGGIRNRETITLLDSTVRDNSSTGNGGGIYNQEVMVVTNSTISRNSALGASSNGGEIHNQGTMTLSNSTVSSNSADGDGGGIANQADAFKIISGNLTLINITISGNSAGLSGGGIYKEMGCFLEDCVLSSVELTNSIIGGNTSSVGPDCFVAEFDVSVSSLGYNLIGDTSDCGFSASTGDQVGTAESPIDPLLGPLRRNGGPTPTHALRVTSPAIDAIPAEECNDIDGSPITVDQRGVVRPQGAACDMGAYERRQP